MPLHTHSLPSSQESFEDKENVVRAFAISWPSTFNSTARQAGNAPSPRFPCNDNPCKRCTTFTNSRHQLEEGRYLNTLPPGLNQQLPHFPQRSPGDTPIPLQLREGSSTAMRHVMSNNGCLLGGGATNLRSSNDNWNVNVEEMAALQQVDEICKQRRRFASSLQCNPKAIFTGIPPRIVRNDALYSRKVFVGGFTTGSPPEALWRTFSVFGLTEVEYNPRLHFGHAYLVFRTEMAVKKLISVCTASTDREEYRFIVPLAGCHKMIQVKPFDVRDIEYQSERLTPGEQLQRNTVFVGNVHGTLSACQVAYVMEFFFGHVSSCSIDVDKWRHPCGSARVAFSTRESFMAAIMAEHVQIKNYRFLKTMQIDPYLCASPCVNCGTVAKVFCRSTSCFSYFCGVCFLSRHANVPNRGEHMPLMRKIR